MKKLFLGFVIAVSLAVSGIAGTASATGPDTQACAATSGKAGAITVIATPAFVGGCSAHSP